MRDDQHPDVKVSIITVVYNAVDQIEETLKSVLAQRYSNLEYIVVDGGSTDGTVDVVSQYSDRIAHFVSERDKGIYDAMNKGIRMATGEWIGIMNAGDVFASDDVLNEFFVSHGDHVGIDVVFGDAIVRSGTKEWHQRAPDGVDGLSRGPTYRHGASFVRRTTHLKYLFDLSLAKRLEFALDYEQIYRMFKGGCKFEKVPVPVLKYELRGASTVSPFKPGYYCYLITHDMQCSPLMRLLLVLEAFYSKAKSLCIRKS